MMRRGEVARLISEHGTQIKSKYATGWTVGQLTKKYETAWHNMQRALDKMGVPRRDRSVRGRAFQLRSAQGPQIVKLYVRRRWSTTRIAKHFGVSHFLINKILRERGVEIRAPRRDPIPLPPAAWPLILQGRSQKSIAAELGLGVCVLAVREARMGVPNRKSRAFNAWLAREATR